MSFSTSPNLVLVDTKKGTYAYNSIFGGLRKLNSAEMKLINGIRGGVPFKQDFVFENLIKYKFVSDGSAEKNEILSVVNNYKQKIVTGSSITKLLLMVTEKCMLTCTYCYVPDAPGNEAYTQCEDMKWETAKQAIDAFREVIQENKQKHVHIRFHGGEPLLNFTIIKQSILYIEDIFTDTIVDFHINSNGIVMNNKIAKFLSEHNVNVEISLDGIEEIHNRTRIFPNKKGSFTQAINAIELLKEYNPALENINLAVTLNRENYSDLNSLVDLACEIGMKEIEVNTLLFEHPLDILEDVDSRVNCLLSMRKYGVHKGVKVTGKWFKLFERLDNPVINYCGRMGQQLGVDYAGEVFLCTGYMERLGNISAWRQIIKKKEYIDICMRVIENIEECDGCDVQGFCAGGCTASVVKSYESFDSAERKECDFRKKMIFALINNVDSISNQNVLLDTVDSSYVPTVN